MTKKKHTPDSLIGFIEVQSSIECSKCNKGDGVYGGDNYDTAPELFKKGWRATIVYCYCPECAKKYLKSK